MLLLDEPFTGVDVTARQKTLDVLGTLRERDVTVLVSTHDLELAATRFDHVVLLNRRVIAQGPPAVRPDHRAHIPGVRGTGARLPGHGRDRRVLPAAELHRGDAKTN